VLGMPSHLDLVRGGAPYVPGFLGGRTLPVKGSAHVAARRRRGWPRRVRQFDGRFLHCLVLHPLASTGSRPAAGLSVAFRVRSVVTDG